MNFDPKKIKEMLAQKLEQRKQCFQSSFETEVGYEVIKTLVVESRCLINSLGVSSNLKSKYQMSSDYFLAQSDFGKTILSYLNEKQIAKLIADILTQTKVMRTESEND